jgi:peptidoglycan hydrolase CwlO-like protein
LVEHCQADVGSIENDVSDVQERWDAICSVLHEVQDKIPKMKEAVPVYEEKVKPLEQCLVEANDVLVEVEPFGLSFGNEQLNKLKVRHILYIN